MRNTVLLSFATMLCLSCGSSSSESTAGATGATEVATVGIALANLESDIYSINQVGKTCGTQNYTATCPNGGTVVITGSDTCTSSSVSMNYIYTMTSCSDVSSGTTVTVTGTATVIGSLTSSNSVRTGANYTFRATTAATIVASGTGISAAYNKSCTFAITTSQDNPGEAASAAGTLCDETFSSK